MLLYELCHKYRNMQLPGLLLGIMRIATEGIQLKKRVGKPVYHASSAILFSGLELRLQPIRLRYHRLASYQRYKRVLHTGALPPAAT